MNHSQFSWYINFFYLFSLDQHSFRFRIAQSFRARITLILSYTMSFQDLPEELILKVLSYSEPIDLITSGQVSKRFRTISHDCSLWQRVNLSKKVVKTEFLEVILSKGCKSLNLSESTIINSFSIYQNSQLRELDLSGVEDVEASEEILASYYFLEKLKML